MSLHDTVIREDQGTEFAHWLNKLKHKRYNKWEDFLSDPDLEDFPGTIEMEENGELILSPLPANKHTKFQTFLVQLLPFYLQGGIPLGVCGVRRPEEKKSREMDAGWISNERDSLSSEEDNYYFPAPEICIEVKSPRNSWLELHGKKQFYFERGALEVWLSDEDGNLKFYQKDNSDSELSQSKLCSAFPNKIPRTEQETMQLIEERLMVR